MQLTYRVSLHGVKCLLVSLVKVMSAVHLRAWLLPDRIIRPKVRGDHLKNGGVILREDIRFEYGPRSAKEDGGREI